MTGRGARFGFAGRRPDNPTARFTSSLDRFGEVEHRSLPLTEEGLLPNATGLSSLSHNRLLLLVTTSYDPRRDAAWRKLER